MSEGVSGVVLEWLIAGRIDIGLLFNTPSTGSLLVDELYEENLYLFGPEDPSRCRNPVVR